ncbi:uncharacterized protein KZ484_012106 [Pholidichthys leucotaenia]
MSSVQPLREFIREKLAAAAEDIFTEFQKTIIKYEEEIEHHRKLLHITRIPKIKLHRIDFAQLPDCKEEVDLFDQQPWNLDQKKPDPPQEKEEQEELFTSQEGERLVLKLEVDAFRVTPVCEAELNHEQPHTHNSVVTEVQDQERSRHPDSGSTKEEEPRPKKGHLNSDNDPLAPEAHSENETGKHTVHGAGMKFVFKGLHLFMKAAGVWMPHSYMPTKRRKCLLKSRSVTRRKKVLHRLRRRRNNAQVRRKNSLN